MTTTVMAQRNEAGDVRRKDRGARARPHGGPNECGCGRTGCHAEFVALAAVTDSARRGTARARLIETHLDLAHAVAARYRQTGPGFDDIRQVAALALVEAVDRFDPRLASAFSAYAVPTIAGAIKRHFRDQRWMLHPPRRIKELRLRVRAVSDQLAQQLGRPPTVADLAAHLGCTQQEICEALCTDDALRPLSIDAPVGAADDDSVLAGTIGGPDPGYTHVDNLETLRPLLAELPERELRVLSMRFVGNLTQSQIADQIGCSQMQISRILRAALSRLRQGLQNGPRPRADGRGGATAGMAPDSRRTHPYDHRPTRSTHHEHTPPTPTPPAAEPAAKGRTRVAGYPGRAPKGPAPQSRPAWRRGGAPVRTQGRHHDRNVPRGTCRDRAGAPAHSGLRAGQGPPAEPQCSARPWSSVELRRWPRGGRPPPTFADSRRGKRARCEVHNAVSYTAGAHARPNDRECADGPLRAGDVGVDRGRRGRHGRGDLP